MRIAHFIQRFSKVTETFIYDQLLELDAQGLENHAVVIQRLNAATRPFARTHVVRRRAWWDPIRVGRLFAYRAGLDAAGDVLNLHVHTPGIREAMAAISPDVIHAHFGHAGVIVAPVARALGVPLVVGYYGHDASRMLSQQAWLRRFKTMWDEAAAVLVLSRDMASHLVAAGCPQAKVHVVHLGKRLADYAPHEPKLPVRQILSVGRLVEKKGHLDLLRAFQLAMTRGDDLTLTIAGDGPLRATLEAYVASYDLQARVRFLGEVDHAVVRAEMQRADAFALTCRTASDGDQEGTPTVLIEAQACGLPVVSTVHSGVPEVIAAENHWLLAPEGDVPGIATRIKQLARCSLSELRTISTLGREKVEREFDIATEMQHLTAIYANVAAARGVAPPSGSRASFRSLASEG